MTFTGGVTVTVLVAVGSSLPFEGPFAEQLAAALVLLFLLVFAFAFFSIAVQVIGLVPAVWPRSMRIFVVVTLALLFSLVLLFYPLMPAALVFAWCKVGFACGDFGNTIFNTLLDAGGGLVVLLLPAVTVPLLVASYWLSRTSVS